LDADGAGSQRAGRAAGRLLDERLGRLKPASASDQARRGPGLLRVAIQRGEVPDKSLTAVVTRSPMRCSGRREACSWRSSGGVGLVLLVACVNVAGCSSCGSRSGRRRWRFAGRSERARRGSPAASSRRPGGGTARRRRRNAARVRRRALAVALSPRAGPRLEDAKGDPRRCWWRSGSPSRLSVLTGLARPCRRRRLLARGRCPPRPAASRSAEAAGAARWSSTRGVALALVLLAGWRGTPVRSFVACGDVPVGYDADQVWVAVPCVDSRAAGESQASPDFRLAFLSLPATAQRSRPAPLRRTATASRARALGQFPGSQ
jgi:hypothetical protein